MSVLIKGIPLPDVLTGDMINGMVGGLYPEVVELPDHLPTIDPVKHGKWEPFDLTWGRSVWACDACGETADVPTLNGKPIFDYCPWCGAKMERSEE